MTTTRSELCEDTDLRHLLIAGLDALVAGAQAQLAVDEPGYRGFVTTKRSGHRFSMSWLFKCDSHGFWPRNTKPLVIEPSITIDVGKFFAGEPITLFNGTAHPNFVNSQGIISFRGEEARRIATDTSDLRWN